MSNKILDDFSGLSNKKFWNQKLSVTSVIIAVIVVSIIPFASFFLYPMKFYFFLSLGLGVLVADIFLVFCLLNPLKVAFKYTCVAISIAAAAVFLLIFLLIPMIK